MAYDEALAERIRAELAGETGLVEKAMFGGLAFLLDGNMAVAIGGEDLMVRVGADGVADALARPHARESVMGERVMKGWVLVAPAGLQDDLSGWVARGVAYARGLPPK